MFVQGIRGAVDVTRTGAIGHLNVRSQFQNKKTTLGSTESNSITDKLDIREQSNTVDCIPVNILIPGGALSCRLADTAVSVLPDDLPSIWTETPHG
jgi:hypothetical protein